MTSLTISFGRLMRDERGWPRSATDPERVAASRAERQGVGGVVR